MRAYSSDSKNDTDGSFGFQSLGPLFPAPTAPGRYSRPKERRAEGAASSEGLKESILDAKAHEESMLEGPLFLSGSSTAEKSEPLSDDKSSVHDNTIAELDHDTKKASAAPVTHAQRRDRRPADSAHGSAPATTAARRGRNKGSTKITRLSNLKEPRLISPFEGSVKQDGPAHEGAAEVRNESKAWGLMQEDEDTVAQRSTPSSMSAEPTNETRSKAADKSTATGENRLTHVKSSGEAHMVDVGAKPHARRVAIAVAHIRIEKDLCDQIEQNKNKKGDVLGVARIAGIMAAKRTSDIIPLCHPLAITKAEVDVYLVPAGTSSSRWSSSVVAIQARVECVGPTGVEMEALTAVQGAALTVYDMCKAVDKNLAISNARVVYKAGGRSGVWVHEKWKKSVGEGKFGQAGELKDGVDVLTGL